MSEANPLRWLAEQGGAFVLIPPRSKAPKTEGWQEQPHEVTEAEAHAQRGGNVGLLVGKLSQGLCAFDVDEDFPGFLQQFPALQHYPQIRRPDAPERGKVLVRIEGEIPPPKKWKPHPRKPPLAEWLATGNQALVPPSVHPEGARFELLNAANGVPLIAADEIDRIWFKWTRTHLVERQGKTKKQLRQHETPNEWGRVREDVRARFDMTAYACRVLNASYQRENADENRVLGQGGLLINHRKGVWNTFGEDGTGTTGGNCFALVAYLKYGEPTTDGDRWLEVLKEAADFAGVALPEMQVVQGEGPPVENEPPPWAYDAWGHDAPTNGHLNGHAPEPVQIYSIADLWAVQAGIKKAWGGWMLMNNITLIGGVPNVGKSPLLLWLVKCYLEGYWPDGTPVPDEMAGRGVVYCLPEGFAEQTEVLLQWGLDREELAARVKIPALPGTDGLPNYQFKLDARRGMPTLAAYCEAVEPGLIVIDGLRAAMVGDESSSADADRFFEPLNQLATRYCAGTILSHHLTKGSESASRDGAIPSLDWFRGSGEIAAKPRAAWIVDQPNPDDQELRRITLVKAAAGPKLQMMAFRMSDPALGLNFLDAVPPPPPKTKQEHAERFILQALRQGSATHEELLEMCQTEGLGISASTFKNARVALSDRKQIIQVIQHGHYYWSLPALVDEPPSDLEDADIF